MRGLRRCSVLVLLSDFFHSLNTSARQAEWLMDVLFGLAEEQLQHVLCEAVCSRDGRTSGPRMVFVPLSADIQSRLQPELLLRAQPMLSSMLNERVAQWSLDTIDGLAHVSHGRIVLTVSTRPNGS